MIELVYGSDERLESVEWTDVRLNDISGLDLKRLKHGAEFLKSKRIENKKLEKGGKIGRNDPCPCASGKKYKKCCL